MKYESPNPFFILSFSIIIVFDWPFLFCVSILPENSVKKIRPLIFTYCRNKSVSTRCFLPVPVNHFYIKQFNFYWISTKIILYKICTKLLKPLNEDRSTNQSYHKRITITAKWFDIRVHDSWRGHSPNCTKQWRVIQGNRTESSRLYNLVDHLNITHYQSKVRTDTFSDEHIFVHKYKLNLFTKLKFF